MMASSSMVSYIKDVTKCAICLSDFTNPRSLPCLHSFCLQCLETHYSAKAGGEKATCALCREEFVLPVDGAQGLKHNFFLEGLVSAQKAQTEKSFSEPCEVCQQHGEEKTPATNYCVDCRQKLCERCSRPHKLWRAGGHQVVQLGEEVKVELMRKSSSYCEQHRDETLKMYCMECQMNMCLMCFAVRHRQHECQEIEEAAAQFQQLLKTDVDQASQRIAEVGKGREDMEKAMETFLNQMASMEREIKQTGERVRRLVDMNVQSLIQELNSLKEKTKKDIVTRREQLDLALTALDSFKNYSQELQKKGAPCDITKAANELHDRAAELLKTYTTPAPFNAPRIVFTPNSPGSQLVGSIRDDATRMAHTPPHLVPGPRWLADCNTAPCWATPVYEVPRMPAHSGTAASFAVPQHMLQSTRVDQRQQMSNYQIPPPNYKQFDGEAVDAKYSQQASRTGHLRRIGQRENNVDEK